MLYDYVREKVIVLDDDEQFGPDAIRFRKPRPVESSSFAKYMIRKAIRGVGHRMARRIAPTWWAERVRSTDSTPAVDEFEDRVA